MNRLFTAYNRKKRFAWFGSMVTIAVALWLPVRAGENGESSVPDFESFRIIVDRNVFDPNRVPVREQEPVIESIPVIETFSLFGTMVSEEGAYAFEEGAHAFFGGTKASYDAVFDVGGIIEGHRIVKIETDCVTLEKDGHRIELTVGSGMSRAGEGEWKIASKPDRPAVRRDDRRPERRPDFDPSSGRREGRGRFGERSGGSDFFR